jgi:hypothetical protein
MSFMSQPFKTKALLTGLLAGFLLLGVSSLTVWAEEDPAEEFEPGPVITLDE